ncbi:MAG: hypothetical protein F4X83_10610 [Chloroflexi bacterium]|nr:hypothetical protein [Chloroflexota bacterium]
MPTPGVFIDTNLLLLLVVGSTDKAIIPKHKRLKGYTAEDYDTLLDLLDLFPQVLVTPHTLAETSNLLAQHKDPERARLFGQLRFLIHECEEVAIAGTVASNNSAFPRLGLTDAALLELVAPETPLLTVDWGLFQQAMAIGADAAVNFTDFRELD